MSYKILPGLVATGEPTSTFSVDGTGLHTEGLVVEFDGGYRANFVRGNTDHDAVYTQCAPEGVHVLSGGNHYIFDLKAKKADPLEWQWICTSVFSEAAKAVVVFDGIRAIAYQGRQKLWESERISWDGIRSVVADGDEIHGEGYNPIDDVWVRFQIAAKTGKHMGGCWLA
jgi:hypothetical protein